MNTITQVQTLDAVVSSLALWDTLQAMGRDDTRRLPELLETVYPCEETFRILERAVRSAQQLQWLRRWARPDGRPLESLSAKIVMRPKSPVQPISVHPNPLLDLRSLDPASLLGVIQDYGMDLEAREIVLPAGTHDFGVLNWIEFFFPNIQKIHGFSFPVNNDYFCKLVGTGKINLVHTYIKAGADVNGPSVDGESQICPLHCVVNNGDRAMFALLLHAGAQLSVKTQPAGWTPLHVAVALEQRAILADLLEAGADPLIPDRKGETAISLAECFGLENFREIMQLFALKHGLGEVLRSLS